MSSQSTWNNTSSAISTWNIFSRNDYISDKQWLYKEIAHSCYSDINIWLNSISKQFYEDMIWQIKHNYLVYCESVKWVRGIFSPLSPAQMSNSCPVECVFGSNGLLSLSKKCSNGRTSIQLVVFLVSAIWQNFRIASATLLNKKNCKHNYVCLLNNSKKNKYT